MSVNVQNTCPQDGQNAGSLFGEDPLLSKCIPSGPFFYKDLKNNHMYLKYEPCMQHINKHKITKPCTSYHTHFRVLNFARHQAKKPYRPLNLNAKPTSLNREGCAGCGTLKPEAFTT